MNIFEAIQQDNVEFIKDYIAKSGNINIKDESGYSALYMSAIMDRKNIFDILKNSGAISDIFVESAIGNIGAIIKYLKDGFDVNIKNSQGHTILMAAAHQGHYDIVKLLIDAKADLNTKHPISGNTALIGASYNGHTNIVKLLINAKVDINGKNNENKTALNIAIEQNHYDIIDILRKAENQQ